MSVTRYPWGNEVETTRKLRKIIHSQSKYTLILFLDDALHIILKCKKI